MNALTMWLVLCSVNNFRGAELVDNNTERRRTWSFTLSCITLVVESGEATRFHRYIKWYGDWIPGTESEPLSEPVCEDFIKYLHHRRTTMVLASTSNLKNTKFDLEVLYVIYTGINWASYGWWLQASLRRMRDQGAPLKGNTSGLPLVGRYGELSTLTKATARSFCKKESGDLDLDIPLRPHDGKRGGLEEYEKIENPALQQMLAHHKSTVKVEGKPYTAAVYTLKSFQKVQDFLNKSLSNICHQFNNIEEYLRCHGCKGNM